MHLIIEVTEFISQINFSHSNRTVYTTGRADVTITNSTFYNITYRGNGAAVYTVAIISCNFADIKAVNGRGAAAYGLRGITVQDSVFISSRAIATDS